MIARLIIPIILSIVLPDLYIDWHHWRHRHGYGWWQRALWWAPGMAMLVYSVALATIRNFVPDDLTWVNVYMILMGLIVVPKALFTICSGFGYLCCRLCGGHRNWGNMLALVLIVFNWYVLVYGFTVGFGKLEVRHVDLYFDDLPPAFDGYRIVHFTDAHVGTLETRDIGLLRRDIDSINAQHADLIAFTGDLQNIRPQEIQRAQGLLSTLSARDGVVSVLGNHDYSKYVHETPQKEAANRAETIARERQCGWRLLLNEHLAIRRGQLPEDHAGSGRASLHHHAATQPCGVGQDHRADRSRGTHAQRTHAWRTDVGPRLETPLPGLCRGLWALHAGTQPALRVIGSGRTGTLPLWTVTRNSSNNLT